MCKAELVIKNSDLEMVPVFRMTSALLEKTCLQMTNSGKFVWKEDFRGRL